MRQRRGGLGRGLDALIQHDTGQVQSEIVELPLDVIQPNPHQPRQRIDADALAALAESIRAHGVVQPIIVTRADDGTTFQLIAGERRWRAARLAGLATIPAIIRDVTPRETLEIALIENVQRADLTPLEEAAAYQALITEFGLTQQELAARVGRSRAAIANTLRLLHAPPAIQAALADGQITEGHARALLGLPNALDQVAALAIVIERGLTVRQTEALVQRWAQRTSRATAPRSLPPALQHVEEGFRRALGTKVELRPGRKGGQIVIHYYSDDELSAIYQRLAHPDQTL